MTFWCPQFHAPVYVDKGQNRQETIHGCTTKETNCMSYFTVTQDDTVYFPLFTFFIIFPSLQKFQVDEKNFIPSQESKPCCTPY